MDIDSAIARINATQDMRARRDRDGRIAVMRYGKPAGYLTDDDLDRIGHTATGFGPNLSKGALQVWLALTA